MDIMLSPGQDSLIVDEEVLGDRAVTRGPVRAIVGLSLLAGGCSQEEKHVRKSLLGLKISL